MIQSVGTLAAPHRRTASEHVVVSPDRSGAREPLGEPAPPHGILDRVPEDIRRLLPDQVIDQLFAGADSEEEIVVPGGLMSQLTKRVVERALCLPRYRARP
jgi:hypothetical protein